MTAEQKRALKLGWNLAVTEWQRNPTAANKRRVIEIGKKLNPRFNAAWLG